MRSRFEKCSGLRPDVGDRSVKLIDREPEELPVGERIACSEEPLARDVVVARENGPRAEISGL